MVRIIPSCDCWDSEDGSNPIPLDSMDYLLLHGHLN